MMSKEECLEKMREKGAQDAQQVQEQAESMTGTELNGKKEVIPEFRAAVEKMNMLERKVGFVCKSTAGRVVRLLQKYDSSIYTAEPEDLPAQWGFVWSDDPAHALPFIALSTSPYSEGNCCTENGVVYRSKINNNVWAPSAYPQGWEKVE
ncbi:hypothetical protein H9X85_02280 [Anaerotignum lactatifermentans]|uniref:Chitin-binding type-3 domain-containing protein n=1 Tax=Anaerotignum lactatifermentans TaxID=160404 RepID=A0ABS2G8S9_9FIRM|nr:hypothetical protein [Anaerotignum lactatifermentans]MBM6828459.1 hypothetical protein [Anaerotignum lactatifermentans]MBM6877866.1 hypothetical protein [Anaerotignum lactatifermentans]MBM6950042.1 hypothetical protein [Anaerotignum lactatifermentans]